MSRRDTIRVPKIVPTAVPTAIGGLPLGSVLCKGGVCRPGDGAAFKPVGRVPQNGFAPTPPGKLATELGCEQA